MCSEGVARDWGTLALPLAASKGQKVGGVPLGDLESGTKSESVSHPNTKLQREWQWARITTACTSSASDQHCSPAFSSVWREQRQELRVRELCIISRFSFRFICVYVDFVTWFFCVLLYLDVWAGSEPWLVGQHLVDVVKKTKTRRCRLQTLQPQRVPTHPQKLGWVQVHQVVTVMACCSLDVTKRGNWVQIQQETFKLEILIIHIQEQRVHWPWWRCNGGNAVAGGRPCAGCSAVCAGSSPSTEGERPSAGTRRPRSPCWPEPSWTAATLAPSHHSPSPTETRTDRSQKVGFWWLSWKVSTSTC